MVHAVVDTGSQHNLIKPEVAQQLTLKPMTKPTPPLVTAVGEDVRVEGVAMAEITMGEQTTPAEFFIVNELTDDIILGLDTLGELGVLIECRGGQVKTRRISDDFKGRFQVLFSDEGAHGCIKGVTHKIETKGRPVVSKHHGEAADWEMVHQTVSSVSVLANQAGRGDEAQDCLHH